MHRALITRARGICASLLLLAGLFAWPVHAQTPRQVCQSDHVTACTSYGGQYLCPKSQTNCGTLFGALSCSTRGLPCVTTPGGRFCTPDKCEVAAACSDGLDNDGDGRIDYPFDPGCASATDTDESNAPLPACSDGIDNDGDGKTDYPADPGCSGATDADESNAAAPACSDGFDNDGDGRTDFPSDSGCASATDVDETDPGPAPACSDGVDNDGDGRTDFPADPGCNSATDGDERDAPSTQCRDGVDNDGDGLIDYPADPDCTSADDTSEAKIVNGTPCPGCICVADLDGDGAADTAAEQSACNNYAGGALCPLQRQACITSGGAPTCPGHPDAACIDTGAGQYMCSANACFVPGTGTTDSDDVDDPTPTDNGPRAPDGSCLGVMRVFSGQGMRCRKKGVQTAFQDCCDNDRGQLQDTMGEKGGKNQLDYKKEATFVEVWKNQCDIKDQQTAQLADSNYCIALGDFCAEKWLGTCVQRSKSYCCFNSMLAKLIQEQGRAQLPAKGGFGSAKHPRCDGFTLQEFQSLDFSKIDLGAYYGEIRTQSGPMLQQQLQDNAHANTGR